MPSRCLATWVRRADGLRYRVIVDRRADDPISRAFRNRQGHLLSAPLVDLMLEILRPGDLFVDLGAHIGTFSIPAAAAGAEVLAVEASSTNVELLRVSAARNGFSNLRVVHAAAADRTGSVRFHESGPWGHVVKGNRTAPRVRSVRLDELIDVRGTRMALIKLDVEGFEPFAIDGMSRLLSREDAPAVLYESNGHCLAFHEFTPGDLRERLKRFGYASYSIEPGRLVRIRPNDIQPQTVIDCLAVKHRPALRAWRVTRPLTRREWLTRIRREARHPHPHHRAYVARVLAGAGEDILRRLGISTKKTL